MINTEQRYRTDSHGLRKRNNNHFAAVYEYLCYFVIDILITKCKQYAGTDKPSIVYNWPNLHNDAFLCYLTFGQLAYASTEISLEQAYFLYSL